MYQLIVNAFIVLICVPFSKCDCIGLSASAKTNVTVVPRNSPYPIGKFLDEFMNSDNISEQTVKASHSVRQSEEDLIFKQLVGYSTLFPYLESTRTYLKIMYKSYILLQPEIKFVQCLTKHFYMRYPNAMRFFQWQNLSSYIRRVYGVSGWMVNSAAIRMLFNLYDDTEFDRARIAIKTAAVTAEKQTTPPNRTVRPTYGFYESFGLQRPIYVVRTPTIAVGAASRSRRRVPRQAEVPSERNPSEIHYKDNMKREQMQNDAKEARTATEMNPEGIIDLINKEIEREAGELFNIDTMFWRGLGFEENSLKRYSLAYCSREYVTNVFQRFMKNIILS